MNKIIECNDCGYRGLTQLPRTSCKYCGGKLEVIAKEVTSDRLRNRLEALK